MRLLVVALTVAGLAACDGGDMSDNSTPSMAMPVPAAKQSFTSFTEKLIRIQSETAEPLAVTGTDFSFPDDDNQAAFAAVVPPA